MKGNASTGIVEKMLKEMFSRLLNIEISPTVIEKPTHERSHGVRIAGERHRRGGYEDEDEDEQRTGTARALGAPR